jgi:choline-glycine betaine transporter
MMAKPDFEATWYPRIGKNAAEELRRGRKIVTFGIVSPVFAVAAGLLIGTGTVDDVLGFASATVVAVYVALFIHAQVRIAAALSEWYGVKIRGIPVMTPRRFDEFAEKRGLHRPDEKVASGQMARSSDTGAGHSR